MTKALIILPLPMLTQLRTKAKAMSKAEDRRVSVSELVRRAVKQSLDVDTKEESNDEKDTTDQRPTVG